MKRLFVSITTLILMSISMTNLAQENPLPDDIHPDTLSRLPAVERESLDDYGKAVYDRVIGRDRAQPMTGPGGISMHIPPVADAMDILNKYLRYESVIGRRYIEVAILVAARAFDQQYEWASHEPTALEEGAPQAVIDAIKYNRPVTGLPEKEALIIQYGREIFQDHHLSAETWARAVDIFEQQGAFEIAAIMADYTLASIMLHAVNQQIPSDRTARMPVD